jgi:hypothetical protein
MPDKCLTKPAVDHLPPFAREWPTGYKAADCRKVPDRRISHLANAGVILGDYCVGRDKRNPCGPRPGNTDPVKRILVQR